MDKPLTLEERTSRSNDLLQDGYILLARLNANEQARDAREARARAQLYDAGLDYETLQPLPPLNAPVARMSSYPLHPHLATAFQQQDPSDLQHPLSAPMASEIPLPISTNHQESNTRTISQAYHCPSLHFSTELNHPQGSHPSQGYPQEAIAPLSSTSNSSKSAISQYPQHPALGQTPKFQPLLSLPIHGVQPSTTLMQSSQQPVPNSSMHQHTTQGMNPGSSVSMPSRSLYPHPGPSKTTNVPFAGVQGRKKSSAKPVPKSLDNAARSNNSGRAVTSTAAPTTIALPAWYGSLSKSEKAVIAKKDRDFHDMVGAFKEAKDNVMRHGAQHEDLRSILHKLERRTVTRELLIHSRLMESQNLPSLYQAATPFTFDVKADAKMLYNKWLRGDFCSDLERGIILSRRDGRWSKRLDDNWGHKCSAKFFGEGDLVNGQWWPNRFCALRDGAHGEIEAGISGHEKAACAVVIAHSEYEDIDHGDVIHYCGTRGKEPGKPSEGTNLLMGSCYTAKPVRLLRSYSLKSPFAPSKGYRYDGLYRVANFVVIDESISHYRFHLERLPGQDPIRHQGPSARPTLEEISAPR